MDDKQKRKEKQNSLPLSSPGILYRQNAAPVLVQELGSAFFHFLSGHFPISCASDEFYYFPQVERDKTDWEKWDDFSPEGIQETTAYLSDFETGMNRLLKEKPLPQETEIDARLLKQFAVTLKEQLAYVRPWARQPSLVLTIASIGLAEALLSKDPSAIHKRMKGFSGFLDQGVSNFSNVPVVFLEIGIKMIPYTRAFIISLNRIVSDLKPAMQALNRFEKRLRSLACTRDFHLDSDLAKQVFSCHLNTGMDEREINRELDAEIGEMRGLLEKDGGWERIRSISPPKPDNTGIVGLYSRVVYQLAHHCRKNGLVSDTMLATSPVRVRAVPEYLLPVRTASSYSIFPGHPPKGGVFFVYQAKGKASHYTENLTEYRMLAAHETYPGHHLLDISRWGLKNPLRRPLEQPLFYEGWACFGEVMMQKSGFFNQEEDRLLLARRRFWRAMRGKVDLGLSTGKLSIPRAAQMLMETGLSREDAMDAAGKYPLNPGYQICYTIGIRRFMQLFKDTGNSDFRTFSRAVLCRGQIGFSDLSRILKSGIW